MMSLTINSHQQVSQVIKFEAVLNNQIVGRLFLYLIFNQLHSQPYGLLEDLFVEPKFRHRGIGQELVLTAINQAKKLGCYKLIGTSRFSRSKVHRFYQEKFGFQKYGYEFRLDLK